MPTTSFPDHQRVPPHLRTEDFWLRPITADDAQRDYAAVMDSREQLRLWEQSTWPEDDFTVEANRADLAEMEERHAARRAFGYTVLDPQGDECLGCVYIFPPGASFLAKATIVPVDDGVWDDLDAVVYFWVRTSLAADGMEALLLAALRDWFPTDWGFSHAGYVASAVFTRQVELMRRAGLTLAFRLREPDKPDDFLVFGD